MSEDNMSYEVHRSIVNVIHDAGLTVDEFYTMHKERVTALETKHGKRG